MKPQKEEKSLKDLLEEQNPNDWTEVKDYKAMLKELPKPSEQSLEQIWQQAQQLALMDKMMNLRVRAAMLKDDETPKN